MLVSVSRRSIPGRSGLLWSWPLPHFQRLLGWSAGPLPRAGQSFDPSAIMQARPFPIPPRNPLVAGDSTSLRSSKVFCAHSTHNKRKLRAGCVMALWPPESIVAALRCSYPSDSSLERLCTHNLEEPEEGCRRPQPRRPLQPNYVIDDGDGLSLLSPPFAAIWDRRHRDVQRHASDTQPSSWLRSTDCSRLLESRPRKSLRAHWVIAKGGEAELSSACGAGPI